MHLPTSSATSPTGPNTDLELHVICPKILTLAYVLMLSMLLLAWLTTRSRPLSGMMWLSMVALMDWKTSKTMQCLYIYTTDMDRYPAKAPSSALIYLFSTFYPTLTTCCKKYSFGSSLEVSGSFKGCTEEMSTGGGCTSVLHFNIKILIAARSSLLYSSERL